MIIPGFEKQRKQEQSKQDRQKDKVTVSELNKIQKCHGFRNGHTDEEYGKYIHKLCQDKVRQHYGSPIEIEYQYASDKTATDTIEKTLNTIERYTNVTGYSIEHTIDFSFISGLADGSADIVIFSEERYRKRIDLMEIKTGNGKQTCNIRQDGIQNKAYALGLLHQYPDVDVVYSWVIKPTVKKQYHVEWERATVMTFEEEINDLLNNDGELKQSEYCAVCPKKKKCKERFTPGLIVKNVIEKQSEETANEVLLYLYLHRNEIAALQKEAKALFEGKTPDEIENVDGLVLKHRSKKKFDTKALGGAFISKGISVDLLYHKVENSVNQIEEVALQHGFTLEELDQYKKEEYGTYYLDLEGRN